MTGYRAILRWAWNTIIVVAITALLFEATMRLLSSNGGTLRALHLTSLANETKSLGNQLLFGSDCFWLKLAVNAQPDRSAATIALPYFYHVAHPTRGWWNKPSTAAPVTTNALGHRTLRESYDKSRNLMLIGDSFTFGVDATDSEAWPNLLQQEFPNVNVVNLGSGGFAIDQMLVTLREEIARYRPDLVIVSFIWDDLARSTLHFRDFYKPYFDPVSQVMRAVPIRHGAAALVADYQRECTVVTSSFTYRALAFVWKRLWMARANELMMQQMASIARANGSRIVFSYIAVAEEFDAARRDGRSSGDDFLAHLSGDGLTVLDARRYFIDHWEDGFSLRSHFTPPENRAYARMLADHIRTEFPALAQ